MMLEKMKNPIVIGKKGDVDRYIVYTIIILILLIVIVALFLTGAHKLIQNLFIKEFLK